MKKDFSLLFVLFFISFIGFSQNPLNIPSTLTGEVIELELAADSVQFLPGTKTSTYGFNGPYLGPTIILTEGDSVHFRVTNSLSETTTVHWHGMHVPSYADGGPHTPIAVGEIWDPSIEVMDKAGTSWYHPHLHGSTTRQVIRGLAGMIIVRDNSDIQQQLPRTYGVDEFPLIMQYQSFDNDNQITQVMGGMAPIGTPMINGTIDPFIDLPAQMIRFHLLNGDEMEDFNLSMVNGDDLMVIGTEGGLLESPVLKEDLIIRNGERYEIILDLSAYEGQTIYLRNTVNNDDYNDFLTINVVAPTTDAITAIPNNLTTYDIPDENNVDVFREKIFTGGMGRWTINNTEFSHMVINDTIQLNDIELWTITNETNVSHPFHIHDEHFFLLDINGNPPEDYLAGPKDVINVRPNDIVRFIIQFEDFANSEIPYMYHCHILPHEDAGMMAQFIVIDENTTSTNNTVKNSLIKIYPNPASDIFHIRPEVNLDFQLQLYDLSGKLITKGKNIKSIDTSSFETGIYILEILDLESGNKVQEKITVAR